MISMRARCATSAAEMELPTPKARARRTERPSPAAVAADIIFTAVSCRPMAALADAVTDKRLEIVRAPEAELLPATWARLNMIADRVVALVTAARNDRRKAKPWLTDAVELAAADLLIPTVTDLVADDASAASTLLSNAREPEAIVASASVTMRAIVRAPSAGNDAEPVKDVLPTTFCSPGDEAVPKATALASARFVNEADPARIAIDLDTTVPPRATVDAELIAASRDSAVDRESDDVAFAEAPLTVPLANRVIDGAAAVRDVVTPIDLAADDAASIASMRAKLSRADTDDTEPPAMPRAADHVTVRPIDVALKSVRAMPTLRAPPPDVPVPTDSATPRALAVEGALAAVAPKVSA
ncbi:MAG: hypothetical protein JO326_03390 [Acetobacteraceae bacterium]|nr:hypothetical protein [Acetobacteraceae bacterium]